MSSLPVAWIAIGSLLLLLVVVMATLFFLKSREVTVLKKQCEDLRETMRMMRYEEANLARMLHTASKPTTPLAENPVEELPIAGEAVEPLVDSVAPIAEELVEMLPRPAMTYRRSLPKPPQRKLSLLRKRFRCP